MTSWEEFDKMVENDTKTDNNLLNAYLEILLAKNMITKDTTLVEIQQILLAKYNVGPALEEIENELYCIMLIEPDIIETKEDFFEGY